MLMCVKHWHRVHRSQARATLDDVDLADADDALKVGVGDVGDVSLREALTPSDIAAILCPESRIALYLDVDAVFAETGVGAHLGDVSKEREVVREVVRQILDRLSKGERSRTGWRLLRVLPMEANKWVNRESRGSGSTKNNTCDNNQLTVTTAVQEQSDSADDTHTPPRPPYLPPTTVGHRVSLPMIT
ncbi:hypothetical protein BGW80DRAFT_1326628 [Lactifluus volemus]|nr:hypothetical protein BGW80DRAFT_1326628 [Lactifluus volemus]